MTRRLGRQIGLVACIALLLSVAPPIVSEWGRARDPGNLAEQAHVTVTNAVGDPQFVVGSYSGEGEATLLLASETGELRLEFAELVTISTLVLRANRGSEYVVETSEDAEHWSPVWTASADDERGRHTWTEQLIEPVSSRFVRVRSWDRGYGELPEISQVRLYAGAPPEGAESAAPTPRAGFPWLSRRQVERTKAALGFAGAALACASWLVSRGRAGSRAARWLQRAFVAVALVAGLGWWNFFQISGSDFVQTHKHYHDFYHYYLGAKYLPELSYTNLYRCQVAADTLDGLGRAHRVLRPKSRDLRTDRMLPTAELIAEADACRLRFTDERWSEFRRDNSWFRTRMTPGTYLWIGADHGFNGSPAFAVLARPLAEALPLSDFGFGVLTSIDTLLLVAVWFSAWSCFGAVPTSAALLLWATNLVVEDREFFAGSYMRIATFALAMLGVCSLRVRRPLLAGFLLGYATMLRLFPVFLLIGGGLSAAWDVVARRSLAIPREARRFGIGAVAAAGALLLLGGLVGAGPSSWWDFARNTRKHLETPTYQRIGLAAVVAKLDPGAPLASASPARPRREAAAASPLRRTIRFGLPLLVFPLLLFLVRREEQWVAAILGVAWLPFVTDLSNYDWNIVALFGLLTARLPSLLPGIAMLNVALVAIGLGFPRDGLDRYLYGSLAMMLFSAIVLGALCWNQLRGRVARGSSWGDASPGGRVRTTA